MDTDRPLQPYKLSAHEYGIYAAGYAAASRHVEEQAKFRGADFDRDMILVFLHNGAKLRADHAARLQATESSVADRLDGVVEPLVVSYTNHRGETAVRRIIPVRAWFGVTEWHPEPQWLLDAFDTERKVERSFALRDMSIVKESPRLLSCGLCFEENGEEVHPHPECPGVG